jgi:hypothetical protein
MEEFMLEKTVWDDNDFSIMGWHDATLWAMMANPPDFEFLIDLDYIFKWVNPKPWETYFKFWVAPATMMFENVHDVKINIESSQGIIEIADLLRENPHRTPNGKFTAHTYRFECQEGEISLIATGFKMFVRRMPELLEKQRYELAQRQGIGFSRTMIVS